MRVQVQTSFHERQQTQQNHSQRTAEPGTVRKTKTPLAGENDTKTRLNLLYLGHLADCHIFQRRIERHIFSFSFFFLLSLEPSSFLFADTSVSAEIYTPNERIMGTEPFMTSLIRRSHDSRSHCYDVRNPRDLACDRIRFRNYVSAILKLVTT